MIDSKLYLIPCTLGETNPKEVIPEGTLNILIQIKTFVVENIRTARRYLSSAGLKGKIDGLKFVELNEHTSYKEIEEMLSLFSENVGLISEAGLPAVADPGAKLVDLCHKNNIRVIPLVGPSSLMLSLMASGLNGQSFAFCGYLPAKSDERKASIKAIEKVSAIKSQTQIFIETPYRNDSMLKDLLSTCNPNTKLCIASNITLNDEFIKTMTIKEWKKISLIIGKNPCVFLIQAK